MSNPPRAATWITRSALACSLFCRVFLPPFAGNLFFLGFEMFLSSTSSVDCFSKKFVRHGVSQLLEPQPPPSTPVVFVPSKGVRVAYVLHRNDPVHNPALLQALFVARLCQGFAKRSSRHPYALCTLFLFILCIIVNALGFRKRTVRMEGMTARPLYLHARAAVQRCTGADLIQPNVLN